MEEITAAQVGRYHSAGIRSLCDFRDDIEPGATAIWVASVRRNLKQPQTTASE